MKIVEEFIGKTIIDAQGNEIGKLDDIIVNMETKTLDALVIKGKGILSKEFQTERLEGLLKRTGLAKTEDLFVPVEEIQAIGKFIILKKAIDLGSK